MNCRYSGLVLLLSNATIIDGSGADPIPGSLAIDGERIAAITASIDEPADAERIDCAGLTIAPGFIDLHSHSDLQVLEQRSEKLKQGVTTEAVGNCGFSPFPFSGDAAELRAFGAGILGKPDGWGWASAAGYLRALDEAGVHGHVLPFVGHGSLRIATHGPGADQLTTAELDRMCGLLGDSLDAGCAGFTTGLMYAPGSAADDSELEALCRVVAQRGKLYASHIRGYSGGLVNAIDEQIRVAERTGCRLQISHLQTAGRQNWHLQAAALERIESARKRGIDIEFDIYPYQCGSTVLTQFLPLWALDGGIGALLARLQKRDICARLHDELIDTTRSSWSDVTISSVESVANQPFIGRTVTEIAQTRGIDEADAVLALLAEEKGAVNIVSFNQSEDNLRQLITHPLCSIITDGFYVKGKAHPRLYGTYPELLGKLVRERKWLDLPAAIHKSTVQPAARLGLTDRGILQAGRNADLVAFNAERIASEASYTDPAIDPNGIAFVMRRGQIVWRGDAS